VVQYPPGHGAGAKAVAAVVPGAKLVETTAVSRVTLALGTDGKQVTGLTPGTGRTGSSSGSSAKATAAKPKPADGLGCID
jgi:hypothetical protein